MDILKSDEPTIRSFLDLADKNKSIEFEYIYGLGSEKLTRDQFIKCIEYCNDNYTLTDTSINLDIKTESNDIRTTLTNINDVKIYCKTDDLKDLDTVFLKKKVYLNEDRKKMLLRNSNYNYSINLKTEEKMELDDPEIVELLDSWKNRKKYFRYKKRTSFNTPDGNYRIDITIVKSNSKNKVLNRFEYYKSFTESKVLQESEIYELEIEYIANDLVETVGKSNIYKSVKILETTDDIQTHEIIKESSESDNYKILSEIVYQINSVIYNTPLIINKTERENILSEYYKLTNQSKKLIVPQPVTLSLDNLNMNNAANILKNYAVTEKADGYRYILYIDETKTGYLIDSKKNVVKTGIVFTNVEGIWILDGEYIVRDRNNQILNLFMIFDVYYANNEPVYKRPFISKTRDRNDELTLFREILKNTEYEYDIPNNMNIGIKNYELGTTRSKPNKKILDKSREILNRKFVYRTDGLIYLPIDIPVGSGIDKKPVENIGGTWNLNYKWKPPEENTIDFRVVIVKETVNKKLRDKIYTYTETVEGGEEIVKYYKKCRLKVGYNERDDDSSDFCMKMLLKTKSQKKTNTTETVFDPPDTETDIGTTNIELNNGKMICESGEELRSGDIVEMRYEKNDNDMIWHPIRKRFDKTNPQYFTIANNIWSTIVNPVTTEMIRGRINLRDIEFKTYLTDGYYIADEDKNYTSTPLRQLHNYIKSKLIGAIGSSPEMNHKKRIMDTSIGRGGDLNKYMNPEISCEFLFGLDIESVSVACRRFYLKNNTTMKCVFVRTDTSKPIETLAGLDDRDDNIEYNSTMIDILYDKKTKIDKRYVEIRKIYRGLAKSKFHIISCQFSLHYYFRDITTLEGYLENVVGNCKKGGYFIGCCYDGNKIFDRLKQTEPFRYVDKNDALVYEIEKKYTIDEFTKENGLGQRIDVYMESIGKKVPEYLVHFGLLIDIMKKYGFEPHLPKTKSKYENVINEPIRSFNDIIDTLDEEDKDLNRFYKESIEITKNEKLKELSSMNNYFVFKRE